MCERQIVTIKKQIQSLELKYESLFKQLDHLMNIDKHINRQISILKLQGISSGDKLLEKHLKQKQTLIEECKSVVNTVEHDDTYSTQSSTCNLCGNRLLFDGDTFFLVCTHCGINKYSWIRSNQTTAFGSELGMTETTYKRVNHFKERLMLAQGKENLNIPRDTLEKICVKLIENDIRNSNEITYHTVRKALRDLKMNRFYRYSTQIMFRILGKTPPKLTVEQEKIYIDNFLRMQRPFEIHAWDKRTQFLSYPLTLHFLSVVQQMQQFCCLFPELKGDSKVKNQMSILEKISKDLGWYELPHVKKYIRDKLDKNQKKNTKKKKKDIIKKGKNRTKNLKRKRDK